MLFDLYVVAALVVAVAAWLVSPHFRSDDPPGDIVRAFWSAAAGALWALLVVGGAQVLVVRYLTRRLRPTHFARLELTPPAELCDASLRS